MVLSGHWLLTTGHYSGDPGQELEDLLPAALALVLKGYDPLMDPEDGVAVRIAGTHGAGRASRLIGACGRERARWGRGRTGREGRAMSRCGGGRRDRRG